MNKFPRLSDANSICFEGSIGQDRRDYFTDYLHLLEHFRDKLLPLCGGSHRQFEFRISLESDIDAVTTVSESILILQPISDCSNVRIQFIISKQRNLQQLPVETISNWLHQNRGDKSATVNQERLLEIEAARISNDVQMWDHLKNVIFWVSISFEVKKRY